MRHFRRKSPSLKMAMNSPLNEPFEPIKQEAIYRDPKALAPPPTSINSPNGSPSCDLSNAGFDEPGSSKESGWRTAYGAARMAVEIAKESSDMFLPLKAVVGALAVLIRNYDVKRAQIFRPIRC